MKKVNNQISDTEVENFARNTEEISAAILKGLGKEELSEDDLAALSNAENRSPGFIDIISSENNFRDAAEIIESAYKKRNTEKLIKKIETRKRRYKYGSIAKIITVGTVAAAVAYFSFLVYIEKPNEGIIDNKVTVKVSPSQGALIPVVMIGENVVYELKDEKNSTSINEINAEIERYKTGQNNGSSSVTDAAENVSAGKKKTSLKIVIPNGYMREFVLNDGTKVRLNAGSELICEYSDGKFDRNVTLKGEAYFEVMKSKSPFVVRFNRSDKSYVKVYGTSFNINAYDGNPIKTILVEGSVGIGFDKTEEIKLKPNQMAVIDNRGTEFKVVDVDPYNYLGWLDGYFRCSNMKFNDFVRDLVLWYGVEIEYNKADFENEEVNLSIEKEIPLLKVIKVLEEIMNIQFIKDGGEKYVIKRR